MDGKQLIPAEEMAVKVRAAVAARTSRNFTIVARTDARAVEGIERALARADLYRRAGADVLFVEAPESEREIEAIAESLRGMPLLFNWAEGGKTPPVPVARLRELGFRIVIFPVGPLLAAARAVGELLAVLRADGTPSAAMSRLTPFREFVDFLGLPEMRELERRFGRGTG